jgi:hypothetical protein
MPRIAVKTKQEIMDAINKRKQGLQSNETNQSAAELEKAKRALRLEKADKFTDAEWARAKVKLTALIDGLSKILGQDVSNFHDESTKSKYPLSTFVRKLSKEDLEHLANRKVLFEYGHKTSKLKQLRGKDGRPMLVKQTGPAKPTIMPNSNGKPSQWLGNNVLDISNIIGNNVQGVLFQDRSPDHTGFYFAYDKDGGIIAHKDKLKQIPNEYITDEQVQKLLETRHPEWLQEEAFVRNIQDLLPQWFHDVLDGEDVRTFGPGNNIGSGTTPATDKLFGGNAEVAESRRRYNKDAFISHEQYHRELAGVVQKADKLLADDSMYAKYPKIAEETVKEIDLLARMIGFVISCARINGRSISAGYRPVYDECIRQKNRFADLLKTQPWKAKERGTSVVDPENRHRGGNV